MLQDQAVIRREHVERMNGFAATWWHYNRLTVAILLSAVATVAVLLQVERAHSAQLLQDNRTLAMAPSMGCYATDRATSLIIAGGSQQAVDDALRYAVDQAEFVRMGWLAARNRAWPEGLQARKGKCKGENCGP